MKVFHVCADRGVAPDGTKGASVHLRAIASAMSRLGWGVRTFSVRAQGGPFPVALSHLDALDDAIASDGPDVIYERYSLGYDGGLDRARTFGVPFVLEVNAPLFLEATRFRPDTVCPGDDAVEQRLFREADLVVAVSEPLRRYVEAVRGSAEGTAVVRNGFWPDLFPQPAPLDDVGDTIVFLGNPKPFHDLAAARVLVTELVARGRDPHLLVVGGGPLAEAEIAAAEADGLAGRVERTGELPQLAAAECLSRAAVGVAPYRDEPFFYFCPLKVIEYMAAGLPVVTTALGDLTEIVADAGIVVPAGEPRAFTDAVEILLTDRAYARTLGARGRERAFAGYTWDHVANRLSTLIGSLAGRIE